MKRLTISPPLAAVLLAIVLFLLSGFLPNGFGGNLDVAAAQAVNIVRLSVFLGVIAAGQTLVILSGNEGIDLSTGAVVTLTAILTYTIVNGRNEQVLPALLAVLIVGGMIGLINGAGVAFLNIAPLVMTLGMAGVVSGLILVITQGNVSGAVAPIMTQLIARPVFQGIPGAILIWIVFAALMWLLIERTTYGRHLFAIGTNRTTARLSGIRVTAVVIGTYALSGMLAGLGGFLVVGEYRRCPHSYWRSLSLSFDCGGRRRRHIADRRQGKLLRHNGGALVLTLITSLLTTMQMPESVRRMVLGATLLVMISIYGRQRGFRQ
jgi:ribose transport system permease protein